jgi:hypothetical protein
MPKLLEPVGRLSSAIADLCFVRAWFSFNIQLETDPLDRRMALRVASEKAKQPTWLLNRLAGASPSDFLRANFLQNKILLGQSACQIR